MANRTIYNGTTRKIVLKPAKNISIVIPAYDRKVEKSGSIEINEEQYKVLNKSGLFKAMKDRGQLAFKPVRLSESNQRTFIKETPAMLKPKPMSANGKLTHSVTAAQ